MCYTLDVEAETVSVVKAAELLGVSRPFVKKLIRDGKLHAYRNPLYVKGEWEIPLPEVEALARQIREARPEYRA